MRTKLKRNILPKNLQDFCVTTFVLLAIPLVYWFELFVVLPSFHAQWSLWYNINFAIGTFALLNITTNFIGLIICDTSINSVVLPATLAENWRFCSTCECIAPPRSWHCNICNACILKRDHHCTFSGCCVGHYNQRYFLVFVFYMFLATSYATYYNVYFVVGTVDFKNWMTVIKLVFPLAMIFVEYSRAQLFLFLVLIVLIGCVFTGVLLYFHTDMMFNGIVTYERKLKNNVYNYGIKENVKLVLGEKWFLVWLSPFIVSPQKHDGIYWTTIEVDKNK